MADGGGISSNELTFAVLPLLLFVCVEVNLFPVQPMLLFPLLLLRRRMRLMSLVCFLFCFVFVLLGGGWASIAARHQIRSIFDPRDGDGGVLHGRLVQYRNKESDNQHRQFQLMKN